MLIGGGRYGFNAIEFQLREIRDVFTERMERAMARLVRDLELARIAVEAFREGQTAHAAEQSCLRATVRSDELRAIFRSVRLGGIKQPRLRSRTRTCSQASRWMVLQ